MCPAIAPSTPAPVEEYAVSRYARAHVSNETLHQCAITHAGSERGATAELLADLAEIDVRKFYVAKAYPSLFAYCVAELKLSEDAAYNRIKVARTGRRFPVVFEAIASGRLSLTAVILLGPHLTETTAPVLLSAAMDKSKLDVEKLLAESFPRMDMPAYVAPIPSHSCGASSEPSAPAATQASALEEAAPNQLVPEPVDSGIRSKVKPLAPQRFEIHFSMSDSAHEKLRYLQNLLGFEAGELGRLFEDALDARIREVEKQKFAATDQPRRSRGSSNPRHIPSKVKRAVWKRDRAQCTFVSDDGRRCEERRGLQFDHMLEVARGGEATVEGIRLRCWAHNQYEAERTFGSEFMRHKRTAAKEARDSVKGPDQRAVS